MIDLTAIRLRWDTVGSRLDERGRRLLGMSRRMLKKEERRCSP
jgi:hypothetical protein